MELRQMFRHYGVPIRGTSYVFGDNKSVVDSSSMPHARLHKRHNILSFHRVREMIAAKVINFTHIYGHKNPADILSKHWGCADVWELLRPILFWINSDMPEDTNEE